jgi:hypothetical protein
MQHSSYDIFEKFPDGYSIWRACVSGQFEAQRKLQELAEHSENEFFIVDLLSEGAVPTNLPPRTSHDITKRDKRIA